MPKLFHRSTNICGLICILAFSILFTTDLKASEISGRVTLELENGDKNVDKSRNRAVVYLTGKAITEKQLLEKPPIILQKDKRFVPRVLAVTQGQKVTFKSADPVYHNVWSLSKAKPFDLGTFKSPAEKSVVFEKPGLIKTFCNIHPGMIGSILVLKNSFHSTTDEKGNYSIKNIPPGEYTIRVWAEGTTPLKEKVSIKENTPLKKDWAIKARLRSKDHFDKNGKPYKKY